MRKQLILVRHAQAEPANHVQKDIDLELNTSGFSEASRMGKYLSGKPLETGAIQLDAVFSSPAARARLTAQLLTEQLGFEYDNVVIDPEIYEASVRKLMQIINSLSETYRTVMIVGHNPHLSYLAEFLTHREIGTLPTCGVVAIAFNDQPWAAIASATGELVWFEHPETMDAH